MFERVGIAWSNRTFYLKFAGTIIRSEPVRQRAID